MNTASRPRVFLSSTIYDFADLRSAIKFWLEESGYEVAASEFNDFPKEVERNSFDACLDSIDQCQYFILLVGSRAGGHVASPPNTTITIAEYRRAYERAKEGRLKIVALVRRSVWTVREDRKALASLIKADYQKEHGISDEQIIILAKHSSRIVADAGIIFDFINEVARAAEMTDATRKPGLPMPVNNWVHQFETFREIVDVLRSTIVRAPDLRQATLLANLREELMMNLLSLFGRGDDGKLSPHYTWASSARRQFSGGPDDVTTLDGLALVGISAFAYTSTNNLVVHALHEAILSGAFLTYDVTTNRFRVGDVQGAMLELRRSVESVDSICTTFLTIEKRAELLESRDHRQGGAVKVSNTKLGPLVVLHDRVKNVVQLSLALLRYTETGRYDAPELAPKTPFADMSAGMKTERPTEEDILRLVC